MWQSYNLVYLEVEPGQFDVVPGGINEPSEVIGSWNPSKNLLTINEDDSSWSWSQTTNSWERVKPKTEVNNETSFS